MEHPSSISVLDFTYHLPQEKIAAYPLKERDESKLLIYKNDVIREDRFKNIDQFLPEKCVLVFNTTKVVHARLKFLNRNGKTIEVFCLEPYKSTTNPGLAMASKKTVKWNCLVGNLKQWKQEELTLEKNDITLKATIAEYRQGVQGVSFSWTPAHLSFADVLQEVGVIPIPPYLKRDSENIDHDRYQTIYAGTQGSVAAPTAGLHFTDRLLNTLKKQKIETLNVTLHVGAGTFMPVKSATMKDHPMHSEWLEVSEETIRELFLKPSECIIPVGTTSLRTVESIYWMGVKAFHKPGSSLQELEVQQWDPYELEPVTKKQSLTALLDWMKEQAVSTITCKTSILIAPPYQLKLSGGIVTNFHQPQSTLLLLISAIVGKKWKDIYSYALVNDFRFLSYGDGSLLLK